jgi:hypothetical protein
MATYIQGITDYIPKLQPFQPDFNFFQKALETKQGQYDAGYAKISAAYGQLLNSELTREPNVQRRNEFFTGIDNEIKRLSGVDLSLPENVDKANKLFQPLIDNDYFRADLAYTKQYGNARKKSQALRDNPNPKETEIKWWAEGDRGLEFQREDFAKSTDEQSLRFSAPRYVPFVNAAEKLYKFGKDNDINPETLTQTGMYNIVYANGEAAIPKLQDIFGSVVAGDPRIKDMFATQAYVDRKNAMKTGAEKFGGDELAAEKEYLKTRVDEINSYYRERNTVTTKSNDNAKTTKKVLENKIRNEGVDPDLDKDLIALYQNSIKDEQVMATVDQVNKEVLSQTDAINFDEQDIEGLRYRVDNAMSYFLMDNLVNETARSYANAKMKILKFEADPFAVNAQEHAFRVAENAQKFGYDMKLKELDVMMAMIKENGGLLPGTAPFTDPSYSGYTKESGKGGGNIAGDIAVMDQNASAQSSVSLAGRTGTQTNAKAYLDLQNSRIDQAKTEEEKNMIRQQVNEDLGLYNEVVEKGYTYTTDAPTDWGQAGMGLVGVIGGLGLTALSGIGEVVSFGTATPLAAAGIAVGATTAAAGGSSMYEGLAGDQTVTVADKVKSQSGLVKQTADGKYELVSFDQSIGITDPNSGDYWQKVNDRIVARTGTIGVTDKSNPAAQAAIALINNNTSKIGTVNKVLSEMQAVTVENHNKLIPVLANESGVDAYNASQFFTADKSRIKTQEEYVSDFVAAYKDNEQYYPRSGEYDGFESGLIYNIDEEERLADMREDAIDNYEDLQESYETLSKNPDAYVGITTFNPNLMSDAEGVSALVGEALSGKFDPVFYNELPFKDAMSLFAKDLGPAATSDQFRNQKGAKFMFGNGFNITRDVYEETENSKTAAASVYFAMQAASLNYGGKNDTEAAAKRPSGKWTYYNIAANDGNKVAATFTFNPAFVEAHKGSSDNPGITGELATRMSKGEIPEVTFFIDSDKAESAPFRSMQSTMEEFLYERGKLEVSDPNGGSIKFSRDALGGISLNGSIPSINANGEIVNTPVFGTVYNENINSVYNTWQGTVSNVGQANMQMKGDLSKASQNKIKDPNAFQPQPQQ